MSLNDKFKQLADTFRKKYSVNDLLSLDDMIRLNSSRNIIIASKDSFKLNSAQRVGGSLVRIGSTINNSASSWCSIGGLSVSQEKAYAIANDPQHYVIKLHLYVTNLPSSGNVWLKWNDNNSRVEFTLALGDNVVTFPPLTDPSGVKEDSFSIFLHPWFDYAEIDESKSYIEAVASN